MFHFSKLIKTSAKEIFAVWSGFAKSFSRQRERWKLLSAQRICLCNKGRTFLPELLDQCPPTAFLQYLASHNFGKTGEVYSVLTLWTVLMDLIHWNPWIHENAKLHRNCDYCQHRDSKTSEFILDLGLIQLHRPAQRCLETTRARLLSSCDTEEQSVLNVLMPIQGMQASRQWGYQWNDLQPRPEKNIPGKKLKCRCQSHPKGS